MSKMSKATLEFKLEEARMFNKILLEENKKLKEKIKELEQKLPGIKSFDDKEVIKKMFNLYENGYSMKDIADYFNNSELKAARGGSWSKSSVNWIMRKDKNKNIVGVETYNKAISQMKNNRLKLKK